VSSSNHGPKSMLIRTVSFPLVIMEAQAASLLESLGARELVMYEVRDNF
jgi:hypothetical protein